MRDHDRQHDDPGDPHEGQTRLGRRQRADRGGQRPVGALAHLPAAAEARLEQHAEQDHDGEDQLEHAADGVVPQHEGLDDSDRDTADERSPDAAQPAEHRRPERPQQQRRTERDRQRERAGGADEDGSDAGEQAGDHPDPERHAPRRNAGEAGRLRVLRGRPAGPPERAAAQEDRDGERAQRGDDEDQQLSRAEHERADREVPVERSRERLAREVAAARDEQAEAEQRLCQRDRGDEHRQARTARQRSDDE